MTEKLRRLLHKGTASQSSVLWGRNQRWTLKTNRVTRLIYLFMCDMCLSLWVCLWVHICHKEHVEVREQLAGVDCAWVPWIDLRLSDSATNAFILPVLHYISGDKVFH